MYGVLRNGNHRTVLSLPDALAIEVTARILSQEQFETLLEQVVRPGQYLGNEWGARRKDFDSARVRLLLSFPDIYELGMSNFGLKILYQIGNELDGFMVDRSYAPAADMEALMRAGEIPLWAWESRVAARDFELMGFSLQYELTYTNVLNMLDLAGIEVLASERKSVFPLIFGGGPSTVNPEPMADFMDFFIVGDGEESVPAVMRVVDTFKQEKLEGDPARLRMELLLRLATEVPGVYVPALYNVKEGELVPSPITLGELESILARSVDPAQHGRIPPRVLRQVAPLNDGNQPTRSMVSYMSLVHDREVLEVRRGCDRGCRFCQPGYTFLPVRERSASNILDLSKKALDNSGHQEYSLLSLCVSDYTSLHETVRALNREHGSQRSSLSFPSQRADRMNLDIAEELKAVRKSGITLAPEAGTERLRAVVNKGLSHEQIINAIESAYRSGWNSVKLYFMCCLPTERDEDLQGIIDILVEATNICRSIRREDPGNYNRGIEFTCTISNFVPKPFTPFQWFGQVTREETRRKHKVLKEFLRASGLKNVNLNFTEPETSLLEVVISRGGRDLGKLIHRAWTKGALFDAWDDQFKPAIWHESASELGMDLERIGCSDRVVGSPQPWEVVHIGLNNWWLVKEWEKALSTEETAPCTENLCHACGVCTELDTAHELAAPKPEVVKRNPFVKELAGHDDEDSHPSLFFTSPPPEPRTEVQQRLRFSFTKFGDLRFISHLDVQHLLIRAIRRAGLEMAYTQGFNPQPKLSLACPLPLFTEGDNEVAELELCEYVNPEQFRSRLNSQLPPEVQIKEVVELPGKPASSLAAALGSAEYRAELVGERGKDSGSVVEEVSPDSIIERVQSLLESEEIMVQAPPSRPKSRKKRRKVAVPAERDIRKGIDSLVVSGHDPLTLIMELRSGSDLHVKPAEVLECINPNYRWRVQRLSLKDRAGTSLLEHDLKAGSENRAAVLTEV